MGTSSTPIYRQFRCRRRVSVRTSLTQIHFDLDRLPLLGQDLLAQLLAQTSRTDSRCFANSAALPARCSVTLIRCIPNSVWTTSLTWPFGRANAARENCSSYHLRGIGPRSPPLSGWLFATSSKSSFGSSWSCLRSPLSFSARRSSPPRGASGGDADDDVARPHGHAVEEVLVLLVELVQLRVGQLRRLERAPAELVGDVGLHLVEGLPRLLAELGQALVLLARSFSNASSRRWTATGSTGFVFASRNFRIRTESMSIPNAR